VLILQDKFFVSGIDRDLVVGEFTDLLFQLINFMFVDGFAVLVPFYPFDEFRILIGQSVEMVIFLCEFGL
jgi:hypothetical protein